ncbi:MAG: YdcF family protein [Acetobacter sp.]
MIPKGGPDSTPEPGPVTEPQPPCGTTRTSAPPGGMVAIIIFGAALRPDGTPTQSLRNRVESAVATGRKIANALYMPTGSVPRGGVTEAAVMEHLLRDAGVPGSAILPEPTADDTLASVKACSTLLEALALAPDAPVLVATSPFHRLRCMLLMRLAGWRVKAVPFLSSGSSSASAAKRLWRLLHELVATPWDALLILAWRIVRR